MMNHSLKATSLAIAALVLTQAPALAAPSESQLDSIKLYSDVTIAKDTVTSWGPWTEFEPPAAGNPPLTLLANTSDRYRSLPQITTPGTPETPPPPSDLVGFGAFYTLTTGADSPSDQIDGPHPTRIAGTIVTPSTSGSWQPQAFQMDTTAITGTYPPPDSVVLALQEGAYSRNTDTDQTILTPVSNPDAPIDTEAAEAGFFTLVTYIKPADERLPQVTSQLIVLGRPTLPTEMDTLKANNFVATYNGYSSSNTPSGFVPMTVRADIGQSTWSGTWNNGVTDANGAVGFTAAGTISGAGFTSTPGSIAAVDSTSISGSVTGSFFGRNAASLGGVADITKNGVRHVDPFLAVQQPAVLNAPATPAGVSVK